MFEILCSSLLDTRWDDHFSRTRQIIVHNTSIDGSLRGAAMERGIPAITGEYVCGSEQRL
jgi:hypothetical protein